MKPRALPWAALTCPFRAWDGVKTMAQRHSQGDALGCADMPFQGMGLRVHETQGGALGCADMPFQGMGLRVHETQGVALGCADMPFQGMG